MLERTVLVLNRLWQAVNVCSARRAFCLLCAGHAQVVHAEGGTFFTHDFESWRDLSSREPCDEEMVSTISLKIRIPRVIVLALFDRVPRKEVKFTRHNIFERDKNTCQYCDKVFDRRELNLDHVIPKERGGETNWENIVCSCIKCNSRKANRMPHEAGMRLRRKPERPRWQPFLHITFETKPHESWRHFIDLAYWHVELG
jgi:5-methylcytosine-specific restriction endonuclease McrA